MIFLLLLQSISRKSANKKETRGSPFYSQLIQNVRRCNQGQI
jgi:hypothetical protein